MKLVNRRDFLKQAAVASAAVSLPFKLRAATEMMSTRPIHTTGQQIGIVGFGNTSVFYQDSDENRPQTRLLINTLLEHGGNFIDTNAETVWNFEKWLESRGVCPVRPAKAFAECPPEAGDEMAS